MLATNIPRAFLKPWEVLEDTSLQWRLLFDSLQHGAQVSVVVLICFSLSLQRRRLIIWPVVWGFGGQYVSAEEGRAHGWRNRAARISGSFCGKHPRCCIHKDVEGQARPTIRILFHLWVHKSASADHERSHMAL